MQRSVPRSGKAGPVRKSRVVNQFHRTVAPSIGDKRCEGNRTGKRDNIQRSVLAAILSRGTTRTLGFGRLRSCSLV